MLLQPKIQQTNINTFKYYKNKNLNIFLTIFDLQKSIFVIFNTTNIYLFTLLKQTFSLFLQKFLTLFPF